jgi:hypothetical protein
MANALQKKLTVSKKKLRKFRDKAVKFAKNPKYKKYIVIGVVLVVLYIAWKKYGKTTTTTTTTSPGTRDNTTTPKPPAPSTGPGTVTPYPPGNGVMSPKLSDYGYPEHLNLLVTGTSGSWSFKDLSTVTAPDGFAIRYYIDTGEEIITDTPLDGWLWESNFPVMIEKGIIKDGVTDLYFLGTNEPGVVRPGDGVPMSGNTSFGYQQFIFNRF